MSEAEFLEIVNEMSGEEKEAAIEMYHGNLQNKEKYGIMFPYEYLLQILDECFREE